MECYDTLKRSVLKKPDLPVMKKAKKVTFSSTVKVFIDECNSDQKIKIVDPQSNCVEVNIVDKSSDDALNCTDISESDDCNATDFLVHKVIYENAIEHDDDIDTDALNEESSILFENNADDEGLQFVVHKVTDHEDDLIQQELDLEDSDTSMTYPLSEEMECHSDIIGKLSELSIENILTHDKIIAFIDQNTLSLSSLLKSHVNVSEMTTLPHLKEDIVNVSAVSSCLKNTELVLSPPLQELSLDKIVKAQSDNILCELDISPLNSIQETDSDSDLSSEGTMIMMTTEESEKNEQHIRESFLKYESMKKEKVQTKDLRNISESQTTNEDESAQNVQKRTFENVDHSDSPIDATCFEKLCDNADKNMHFDTNLKTITSMKKTESNASEYDFKSESVKKVGTLSLTSNPSLLCDKDLSVLNAQEMRKISFTQINDSCYWDKSLESVQIPKDVREWKILSSPEKTLKCSPINVDQSLNSSTSLEDEYLSLKLNMNSSDLCERREPSQCIKSDELESFVHASKERVQRIRKRYLDKAHRKTGISDSPVRGIRPRFGSTAEILQLMQKKNQPPLVTFNSRNHVSWPCVDTIANSGISVQNRKQLTHMFDCQSLPSEYSLQSSFSSYVSEGSSFSTCSHDSMSSCPSIFFHERGVPEGASPPRSLSEDSVEQYSNEESPNSVVYFSMKV